MNIKVSPKQRRCRVELLVAEMEKGVVLDKDLSKNPERWDRYPLLSYAFRKQEGENLQRGPNAERTTS